MTTKLLFASLIFSSVALADTPPASPDFSGMAPKRHIDSSLCASGESNRIDPVDVVAFKLDSDWMTEGGFSQVDQTARWMKAHPSYRVVLEGHTDKLGLAAYNEDLANRRLNNVRNRLLQDGIKSDRIVLLTYGEVDAISPENPNDRRVVMYATRLPVRVVVNATLDNRKALVAVWTERGSLMQMQRGLSQPVNNVGFTARR